LPRQRLLMRASALTLVLFVTTSGSVTVPVYEAFAAGRAAGSSAIAVLGARSPGARGAGAISTKLRRSDEVAQKLGTATALAAVPLPAAAQLPADTPASVGDLVSGQQVADASRPTAQVLEDMSNAESRSDGSSPVATDGFISIGGGHGSGGNGFGGNGGGAGVGGGGGGGGNPNGGSGGSTGADPAKGGGSTIGGGISGGGGNAIVGGGSTTGGSGGSTIGSGSNAIGAGSSPPGQATAGSGNWSGDAVHPYAGLTVGGGSSAGVGDTAGGMLGKPLGLNQQLGSTGSAPQQVSPVPEPSTWALLLIAFGFLGGRLRRLRDSAERAASIHA
jgi:hypothetical protein